MSAPKDDDLRSIQQARDLVVAARAAWETYAHFSQEQVDRIVGAAASAASSAAYDLAALAVEETGFGVVEHKFIKNKFASDDVYRFIRDMKTVGIIREIPERRVVEIAEPVGVVAAIIPSTNPTSTAIYKILISLKSRNAVVLSPHPSARRCILKTTEIMKAAALAAGAPAGIVACMTEVTVEGTQELMRHRGTSVVLATGGMGLVRAAYSSGKPAFGVGPGNVPAYVESSADVPRAVREVARVDVVPPAPYPRARIRAGVEQQRRDLAQPPRSARILLEEPRARATLERREPALVARVRQRRLAREPLLRRRQLAQRRLDVQIDARAGLLQVQVAEV